nr:MAG: RNA-dependent RNA polymerase [Sanya bunya-like virus 15]
MNEEDSDISEQDFTEEISEPLRWGDYSSDEEEKSSGDKILKFSLPAGEDLETFFCWAEDMSKFQFESISEVTEGYRFFCHSLPFYFEKIAHDKKIPNADLVKNAFKLRHNVFAAIFLDSIGVKTEYIDTDMPLRTLGIESNRTPDYIYFHSDRDISILEFTVSTKWENVLYNKGGGLLDVKYTKEVDMLSEAGYSATVNIIPAILGDDNVKGLLSKAIDLNPQLDTDDFLLRMTEFFRVSRQVIGPMNSLFQYHIRNSAPAIAQFRKEADFLESQIKEEFGTHPMEDDYMVYCFDADFVSYLNTQRSKVASIISRAVISRNKEEKLSLYVDLTNGRFNLKWRENKNGMDPVEVVTVLSSGSLASLISMLSIEKSGRVVGFKEVSGPVPVTVPVKLSQAGARHPSVFSTSLSYNLYKIEEQGKLIPFHAEEFSTIVPPEYRNQLLQKLDHKDLISRDSRKKMIVNNPINDKHIEHSIQTFRDHYSKMRFREDAIHSPKPTFLYPVTDAEVMFCGASETNELLCSSLLNKGLGNYTDIVLDKYVKAQFTTTTVYDMTKEDAEIQSKMGLAHSEFFSCLKDSGLDKVKTVRQIKRKQVIEGASEEQAGILMEKYRAVESTNQLYRECIKKKIPLKTRLVMVRASKGSNIRKYYEEEMSHFVHKGMHYTGVDPNQVVMPEVKKMFCEDFKMLLSPIFSKLNFRLFNKERKPDSPFLTELKNHMQSGWEKMEDQLLRTPLFHSLYMTQSMCKTLFKESCKSYNSDYVHVDNLGMVDTIMIIRGGSKIYSKNMSKLYRLIWPLSTAYQKMTGYLENLNYKIVNINGVDYIVTPWSQMHPDVIYDGMSIMSRFFSYLNYIWLNNGYQDISDFNELDILPLILGLSNRRKTEQFMHNMRYLIVNPIGSYSNINDIMEGFAGFNYTYLDYFLRENLSENYSNFARGIQRLNLMPRGKIDSCLESLNLKCLFTGVQIATSHSLVNSIYSTYLMTKSPVDSKLEQVNNFWPILEDIRSFTDNHGKVEYMKDKSLRFSLLENNPEVYQDDFKYDPIFCQELGNYANGFLKRNVGHLSMENMWNSCINQGFDRIANPNGLRGWNKKNFFNKKGYEVVYEYISKTMEEDLSELMKEYTSLSHQETVERLNQDKLTFLKYYQLKEKRNEEILNRAAFHVVDKLQRGGGREIFVMDIFTKSVQYPVEKFLSKVCQKIPNEFISIPANKRSSIIHSIFFEKKLGRWVKEICRWVLDCRRWAPHSVFQKYVHFVMGMKSVLPSGFYDQFMYLAKKMMEKKLVVKSTIIETMKKNQKYVNFEGLETQVKEPVEHYEFDMKFSFVMGIFNYLSSMMHAFNQMYASELIRDYNLSRGNGLVILRMNAHSDDSAGESQHQDEKSIVPTIALYDWLLKGANHMLSIKKSQINRNQYFEFLSVLYLKNELLPVSPKFVGSLPFKPSDNGYPSDVTYPISKSMEMYFNGCSINESFLMLKLAERHIQNIYQIDNPTLLNPQFFGTVDSFPIDYMIGGPLTEVYKDMKYNKAKFKVAAEFMNKLDLIMKPSDSVKWDMNARLPSSSTFRESVIIPEGLANSWFLENCKTNDPAMNIIWYTNKLRDRKYLASLTNEPDSRRYARIFGSFLNRYLQRLDGSRIKATEVYSGLRAVLEEDVASEMKVDKRLFRQLTGELDDYLDSFEGVELSSRTWYRSVKTSKPIFFSANYTEFGTISTISPSEYTVYRHEPQFMKFFGKRTDMSNSYKLLDSIFEGLGLAGLSPEETFKLVSKLTGRDNKRYNYINHMPTEMRSIQNHEGYALCLIETLHPHLKFDLNLRKQKTADYKKSFARKGIPEPLHDVMKLKNAIKFFEVWGLANEDIYRINLEEEVAESLKRVDTDWLPFLYNEYQQGSMLKDNYYYFIWTKEQSKFGKDWIGDGTLLCNLPEGPLCFEVLNNKLELITSNNDTIEFSKMSSWFISSVIDRELKIRNQLVDPDSVANEKVVLGYNAKKKIWGFGHAVSFDMIFEQCTVDDNDKFNLLYHQASFSIDDSGKQMAEVAGRKKYRLKKAWELEFDKFADVTTFLDPKKLRSSKNPRVKEMCHACAIDMMGKLPYHPETVKRNIGQSKLYRVIYDYPKLNEILESDTGVEDSMVHILSHQKQRDPTFEFPSPEDLVKVSKNPWTGKLPANIQKYVTQMGNKALTDDELMYIFNLLKNINEEDEDRVFSELKMIYGDTTAVQGLVLNIVRDTRLLTMCVQLPPLGRICGIHSDVFEMSQKLLLDGLSYSELLNNLSSSYSRSSRSSVSPEHIFRSLYARAIVSCVMSVAPSHGGFKATDLVIRIIIELWENANPSVINNYRFGTDLMRTTDFISDFEMTKNWLCDIFDCILQVHWRIKALKPVKMAQLLTGFGSLASEISKNSFFGEDYVEVISPRGKVQGFYPSSPIAGMINREFKPLSEEMMMEFECNIGLEEVPEDEVFSDGEEPEPVPWIAYVQKNLTSLDDVRRIRGTGWNVLCGTNSVTIDIVRIKNAVLYKRDNFKNLRDWVNTETTYLVGFFYGKKALKVRNYTRIPWENVGHELNYPKQDNPYFYLEDGKVNKTAIFNDPMQMMEINHKIKALWGRLDTDQAKDFEAKSRRIVRHLDTGKHKENGKIIERINRMKQILRDHSDPRTGESTRPITHEDYKGLIGDLMKEVMQSENLKAISIGESRQMMAEIRITEKILKDRPSNFRVDKNISVLNDIRLRSEMESLVPGIVDIMMTGEMKMTNRSKKQVIRIAENSIKVCTNPEEKRKLSRLLVIAKCFLGSISETTNKRLEDHETFHNLCSLFIYEEEENIGELVSLYNIPPEQETIDYMIDYDALTG